MLKARQAVAIALLACLVVGLGWLDVTSSQPPNQVPREESANNHQADADKRSEKSAAVQINCDPNCTTNTANHERDTVNQYLQKIDPLTVVTFMLVIVVIFQVRDGRRSAERQLRAYVLMKVTEFHRPNVSNADQAEWPIHVVFRNAGPTPAYSMVIKAETYLGAQKPKEQIFELTKAAQISPPAVMAPDAAHTMRLGGIEPGHDKFLASQATGMYCYVWGRVDYIDTFGRKHFTKFQMWQNFMAVQQFGFCEVGNTTDDEFPEPWWLKLLSRWPRKSGVPRQADNNARSQKPLRTRVQ